MLLIDQRPTVGNRTVSVDGSGLDSESPDAVLCPISEDVGGDGREEELVEDSDSEMTSVLERRIFESKTCIDVSRRKVLGGRKAKMEDMANQHVFDKVAEGGAVGKKLIRAKWQNDDGGDNTARMRLGHLGDRCIQGAAPRQSRDDATESGSNDDLNTGDWIEGEPACRGHPRHPSRILPGAGGRGYQCSQPKRSL